MWTWVLAGLGGTALLLAWFAARRAREAGRLRAELQRAQRELERRLSELFSLQELTYVLSHAIELDAIARQTVRFVSRFIECEGVLVAVREEGVEAFRVVAADGALADLEGLEVAGAEAGLVGVAVRRNRVELATASNGPAPVLLAARRVEQAAVAPLHAHGATTGAVAAVRPAGRTFTQDELRLLSNVATHASIALTNARFIALLRASRDQWQTTFDALDDGVALVDQGGRIQRSNVALSRMLSRPVTAAVGVSIADALVGPSPELREYLTRAQTGRPAGPVTVRDAERRRILQVSAFPANTAGAAGWLVVVVQDITQRTAMETELIQSEKMAAVGQLVSGVAHELNNPLTSIAGLAEFLALQPGTPDRDREHLEVIHEQAERAGRIVRNLLSFARKGPTDIGRLDLSELAKRVASLMSYELKLRGVELVVDLAADLPPVEGDRYQLQQVVLNLLTNAVQAVSGKPPNEARRVRLRTFVRAGDVCLAVEDNGPGIPEEAIPHIFDPFFTTKAPGEGTGLGLSVTFGIVEGHRGAIAVQRSPEGGACFEVTLPASDPRRPAPPAGRPQATPPGGTPAGRRILLVDDDPAVRRTITALFAQNGAAVVAPATAADALALLGRESFDAILADPRAPVSSTERLADVLTRGFPELRDRTVFLTADVRPETRGELEQLGWTCFVKPFNVRELQAAVLNIPPGG